MLSTEKRLIIWGQSLQGRFDGPGDVIFPAQVDSTYRVMRFAGEKVMLTDDQFQTAVMRARERLRNGFSSRAEVCTRMILVGRHRKSVSDVARMTSINAKIIRRWRSSILRQHKINMGMESMQTTLSAPKQTRSHRGACITENVIAAQVQKALEILANKPDGAMMVIAIHMKYAREATDNDAAEQLKLPRRTYQQKIQTARAFLEGYFSNAA